MFRCLSGCISEISCDIAIVPREEIAKQSCIDGLADKANAAVAQGQLNAAGMQTAWSGDDVTVVNDIGISRVGGQVALHQRLIAGG